MKQKLGYKSKRSIIITIIILALLAIMGIGIYVFNNGNGKIEAISNDNLSTEQSQQENQNNEEENKNEEENNTQNNSENENKNNQEQNVEENSSTNTKNTQPQTRQNRAINIANGENANTDSEKGESENKTDTVTEEVPNEEYVSEKTIEQEVLVSENYVVNWKNAELNANITTKELSIIKPIINAMKYSDKEKVKIGENITYTIIASNIGDKVGTAVIKDQAPEGTTFENGTIKINDESTNYTEDDLKNGISINIQPKTEIKLTFEVKVDSKVEDDIENIAYVNNEPTKPTETAVDAEIIFHENGGSDVEDLNGNAGDKIENISMPETTKIGYTLKGWYEEEELINKKENLPSKFPAGTTEYWAKWEANTNTKYTIEYYYQENGSYPTQAQYTTSKTGTTDTTASVDDSDKTPTKAGYVFDESYKENVLSGNIAGDGSLVLKVYFKQQFTVKYKPGTQGAFDEQKTENIDYGTQTPEFSGVKTGKPGYSFTGWEPEVADTVTENAEYVAQWIAKKDTIYTVEYYYQEDGKYPEKPQDKIQRTGTTDTTATVTDDDKIPTITGYVFDENYAGNVLSGNVDGYGSLVLKVYFKRTFTVIYKPGTQGTFEEQKTENIGYGTTTPGFSGEKTGNSGFYFVGWNPEVADTVTKDAEYVAKWEGLEINKTRTEIIDADNKGNTEFVDQSGDIIKYKITVTNKGDIIAKNINLTDNHNVTVTSIKVDGNEIDISKRNNTFNSNEDLLIGLNIELATGKSIEVNVKYEVEKTVLDDALKTAEKTIINSTTATLNEHNYTTTDKTDGKEGTTVQGRPELSITKEATKNVKAGDNIVYTITIENKGNIGTTINVIDELVGTTYVEGSAKIGDETITPAINNNNNNNNQILNFEVTLGEKSEETSRKIITFKAKTANNSFGNEIVNTAKIENTDKEDTATTSVGEINVKYNEFTEGQTGTDLNIVFIVDNSSSMNETVAGENFNYDDDRYPVAPSDLSKTKLENAKKAINQFIDSQSNKSDTDMSVVVFNTPSTGNTVTDNYEYTVRTLVKNEDIYPKEVEKEVWVKGHHEKQTVTVKCTEINGVEYEISEKNKTYATDGEQYYYVNAGIDYGSRVIGNNSTSNQELKDKVSKITIGNERSGFGTYIVPAYKLINNNKTTYLSDTKKNIIIVLADGAFNDKENGYKGSELTKLEQNLKDTQSGGEIYCIGFGKDYNEDSLKAISTNNKCESAEDAKTLLDVFNKIDEESMGKEQSGITTNGKITFKQATLNIKVSETCPVIASYDTGNKDSEGNPIMETLFEAKNETDLAKYGLTVNGKQLSWDAKIYAKNNLESDEKVPDTVYIKYYIPRSN